MMDGSEVEGAEERGIAENEPLVIPTYTNQIQSSDSQIRVLFVKGFRLCPLLTIAPS